VISDRLERDDRRRNRPRLAGALDRDARVSEQGDANVLWTRSRAEWRRSPRVLLGVPIIVVIYVANLLSWLWADVLYAIGLFILAAWVMGLGGL